MLNRTMVEPYDFLIDDIIGVIRMDKNSGLRISCRSEQDTWVLCCCISGNCHYEMNGETHNICNGDAILFSSMMVDSIQTVSDESWIIVAAEFHISHINHSARQILFSPFIHITQVQKNISDLLLKCEMIWHSGRSTHIIACRSILEEILTRLIQTAEEKNTLHGQDSRRIKMAIQWLEKGEDFSTEKLAEMTGLSAPYFRTLFKRTTGYTVTQYKNYLRINQARDMMLMQECSVSEAAERVGISDPFYFSRLFKQYFGVAPSKIRNI